MVEHIFDTRIRFASLLHLFEVPVWSLDCPQRAWIGYCVLFSLHLLLLLSDLNLLPPELAVPLLQLFPGPFFAFLLLIVVSDLLVEFLTLFHKIAYLLGKTRLDLPIHDCFLGLHRRVRLEQTEHVYGALRDAGTQILGIYVS